MTEKDKLKHRYINIYITLIALISFSLIAIFKDNANTIGTIIVTFGGIYTSLFGLNVITKPSKTAE